jgi:hypothetical protein
MSWTPGWLGLTSQWGYGWGGWTPAYGPGYRAGFWSGYYAGGWFGPGGYRPPRPHYWRPPSRPGRGPVTIQPFPGPGRPRNNLYNRPGNSGIRPRPGTLPTRPLPARPGTGPRPGAPQTQPNPSGGSGPQPAPSGPSGGRSGGRSGGGKGTPPATRPAPVTRPDTKLPNNVFADRDGNVHRNTKGNWQTRENQTWKQEGAPAPARPAPQPPGPGRGSQARPATQAEPRDGGSIEAESNARDRGAGMAPRGERPNRGK